jgi:serine/threonine kinase 32
VFPNVSEISEIEANSDLQNVASDFIPGKPLTSKSGTLAYLAPEVYAGTGYTSGADWWSLGVLFYECIYNKV